MILTEREKEVIFSEEVRILRENYSNRHKKTAPSYNREEFSSLEEWLELLKS